MLPALAIHGWVLDPTLFPRLSILALAGLITALWLPWLPRHRNADLPMLPRLLDAFVHAALLAALWPAARLLVLDEAGDALCGQDGAPLPLTGADLGGGGPGTAIFLGVEPGGTAWFCVDAVTVNAAAPARTGC